MNICILGQYPPQVGGIATYTKQLEDELTSRGHNVYILTYAQNCPRKDNVFEANVINIPLLRGISFTISSYKLLKRIVKEYNIDVIHANYIIPPGLVASLIKDSHVKIVITAHGSDINILSTNIITKQLIKRTLKRADEVYFVSEKLEEKALQIGIPGLKEKSNITPNTVNTEKFKPITPDKKTLNKKYNMPIVIFIGNLEEQKGLENLLEAKKISETEYTLLIYGDGPAHDKLSNMIRENNIQDTYLMGKTMEPEKIIPESDIMVLPSVSEGASIVALESMSCGKPLISTDTGNIRTTITNNTNGIIVPIRNPSKLSHAIDTLIEDKTRREEIGKNARKRIIEKYSKMNIPYINNIK